MGKMSIPKGKSRVDLRLEAQGLLAEPWARSQISNTTTALTAGTVYFQLVGLRSSDVVTGVAYHLSANGSGVTLGKVGLYDSTGNLLASSANTTSAFTSGAVSTLGLAFSSKYTVPADGGYYLAVVNVGGTPCQLGRDGAPNGGSAPIGSGVFQMGVQTGQTDLPASATVVAATASYWLAAY